MFYLERTLSSNDFKKEMKHFYLNMEYVIPSNAFFVPLVSNVVSIVQRKT